MPNVLPAIKKVLGGIAGSTGSVVRSEVGALRKLKDMVLEIASKPSTFKTHLRSGYEAFAPVKDYRGIKQALEVQKATPGADPAVIAKLEKKLSRTKYLDNPSVGLTDAFQAGGMRGLREELARRGILGAGLVHPATKYLPGAKGLLGLATIPPAINLLNPIDPENPMAGRMERAGNLAGSTLGWIMSMPLAAAPGGVGAWLAADWLGRHALGTVGAAADTALGTRPTFGGYYPEFYKNSSGLQKVAVLKKGRQMILAPNPPTPRMLSLSPAKSLKISLPTQLLKGTAT